ncbi:TdeIII family type II restriction endonuclease [Tenacibaculum discolor]|uniref:TdeIII family type II restriction endonuclease n=1 Tax=Tenacibaculum discolor TaxID=361581 RepID=UPI000F5B2E03|nr:TdeIII family type II restriction endonuclease [Tenacibaculum discolor]
MPLDQQQIFDISRQTVIESITNFIRNRANRVPNFQILDLIIPTERRIRSVVGGMETSLGTTLWEPLAKNLARLNGFEVINANLQAPANMPANLQNTVQIVSEGRISKNPIYTARYCHDRIKEVCQGFVQQPINEFINAPRGFGVDIWLRKEGINYFFDTKTVQSNVGGYTRYFNQLLNWYSYFYARFPESNASARIVFPYNPYEKDNFWDKTIGKGWPLEPGFEGWVENDFWDFCTGIENTYNVIRKSFISISESGDLEEIIQDIFYGRN